MTAIDPFAEADEDNPAGEVKQTQNYIHIRIQRTFILHTIRGVCWRSCPSCRSPPPSPAEAMLQAGC